MKNLLTTITTAFKNRQRAGLEYELGEIQKHIDIQHKRKGQYASAIDQCDGKIARLRSLAAEIKVELRENY